MELRDHPIFVVSGFGNWWPPVWVREGRDSSQTLRGEIGVLTEPIYDDAFPRRLFIRMAHEGEPYMGAFVVDDAQLCVQLHKYLQNHLGLTIEEIGDLDIDFLL